MDTSIAPFILAGPIWNIISNSSAFGIFILGVLVFMSLTSWAIIFAKYREFRAVEAENNKFLQTFRRARSLSEAIGQAKSHSSAPVSHIFLAGYNELTEIVGAKNEGGGLQEVKHSLADEDLASVEMVMDKTHNEQIGKLERRVIFLASTANSAPFMGLLGTVVGIMDAFWSIGERGSVFFAVVAPGIAEALLATIVGLGAAIPAVIAYNWANSKLKYANDFSQNFILEFLARVRREVR
ncbi:MAG TPA: MotA/TolQ/ExbB proton channel family protein [candidate division Zixibacteria bacterium]|nr:MotA/TolQ/ExbB proton channel family protein [candidate division Zixibacteria bacterium]